MGTVVTGDADAGKTDVEDAVTTHDKNDEVNDDANDDNEECDQVVDDVTDDVSDAYEDANDDEDRVSADDTQNDSKIAANKGIQISSYIHIS